MVAPQVSGDNRGNESTWKIVKSKKQIKQERKSNYDKNFPPLKPTTTTTTKYNKQDDSSKTTRSSDSNKTPTKKPSIRLRKVSPDIGTIKIVQLPSKEKKDEEDDVSAVSSSSHEGYFSSDSEDSESTKYEKEMDEMPNKKQLKIQRKMEEDRELDKIIARIENEHITTLPETPKKKRCTHKIKQESDHGVEVAFSAISILDKDKPRALNINEDGAQNQAQLRRIKDEIRMLEEIEDNKNTITFCIKHEETTQQDLCVFDIAMDLSHIHDKTDYTDFIQEKLPRLHDQIIPSSLREIAFLEPMLHPSMSDWMTDGLERALELERIEASMFFHQLKLHGMDHSFKLLIQELQEMWDEYGIPYNKRKKLLLVEIEMVSLLMCDVLPCNYSEQGIWLNDISQGQYYNYFKDINVDIGRKKWLDLLTTATYEWFWKVYTNCISLATLSDKDIVMLNDIFGIVTFLHPQAVQILLSDGAMLQKYMFIKEKATKMKFWVESRHHLYYIWYFFGYRILPDDFPSYDPTGNDDVLQSTR